MEFLSLIDRLPFDLYCAARECSTARNNWLHKAEPPSSEMAQTAIKAAGELFELLEGVPLRPWSAPA
jgi:hypothetical protein